MIAIRRAGAGELDAVNAIYARIDFVRSDADDHVLVAEDDAAPGAPVGVGRLVDAGPDAVELGGMWVDEEHRGRGVAKRIVAELLRAAGPRTVWCIPFARVADLYRGLGFVDADAADAPPAVVEKWRFCRATYPQGVVLLRRRST